MRVLVLGGTRFIGLAAVRRLLELGCEVAIFHRGEREPELPEEVRHFHGGRSRLADSAAELRGFRPDAVLDTMALSEAGTRRVVELFRGVAGRLVVLSSADVYRVYDRLRGVEPGPPEPGPLTEEAPLRERLYPYRTPEMPEDHLLYHYDKILVERAVMGEPELPGTILRLPMVYGPNDYQHRLFPYLKRMDDGRPAIILNEGLAAWRGIHGYVEDMAHAAALCLTRPEAAGRIYHAADQDTLTEAEWVERVGRAAGWAGEVRAVAEDRLPESLRDPYDWSHHWDLDSSRIRTELGYAEVVAPDEAMRRTVEWERANPPPKVDLGDFDYAAEDAVLAADE